MWCPFASFQPLLERITINLGVYMRKLTLLIALSIVIFICGLSTIPVYSAPLKLADIYSGSCSPRISSGPNDEVYVVWHDKDETDPEDATINIYFRRSINSGSSFEQPLAIENDDTLDVVVTYPQMAVDSDGAIYIVYSKYNKEPFLNAVY